MATLALDKCGACGRPTASRLSTCGGCGWDTQLSRRHCMKCERLVLLDNGLGFSGISGGLTGLGGFIFYFCFGWLLGLSIVSAVSALFGFLSVFTLGHKCLNCGKLVIGKHLTKAEREEEARKRISFMVGSLVLAVLAVGGFFLWLTAMRATR